ncbi:Hypothetical protein CINCED_3A011211, partial [Cinara cedri]
VQLLAARFVSKNVRPASPASKPVLSNTLTRPESILPSRCPNSKPICQSGFQFEPIIVTPDRYFHDPD